MDESGNARAAANTVLARLGGDARCIPRDLHFGLPPIGQVLPAHERGVQTPEPAAVLIGQGGGGACPYVRRGQELSFASSCRGGRGPHAHFRNDLLWLTVVHLVLAVFGR
jgi:hypothetical protein